MAETASYVGKVLAMRAGERGPLQYHEIRDETFHVVAGRVMVEYDDGEGLICVELGPKQSWRNPPGAIHRVTAITDVLMFEASAPPAPDDRVNVEAEYP